VVWLGALTGYLFVAATTTLRREPLAGGAVASLSAVLFLWWSQRQLLGGRVRWRAQFPGTVATVIGLLGLRVFSRLVFSPLIASNAVTYGPAGPSWSSSPGSSVWVSSSSAGCWSADCCAKNSRAWSTD
jgi:membrane protein